MGGGGRDAAAAAAAPADDDDDAADEEEEKKERGGVRDGGADDEAEGEASRTRRTKRTRASIFPTQRTVLMSLRRNAARAVSHET